MKSKEDIIQEHGFFDNEETMQVVYSMMEEYVQQSTVIQEGDIVEFLNYVSKERDKFCAFILALDWDNSLRTNCDDFLICFDQMKHRLTTKTPKS